MKLSENLKKIRKENNLSQEQFAEKLGVSRQAVSKWESETSYPEMDKILLICKLYNYNVDELINENVNKVDDEKKSKINFNKYVEDFLNYITKSVNMFISMKFSQKIKLIIEEIIIAFVLFIVYVVSSGLLSSIFRGLGFRGLFKLIDAIYKIIFVVVAVTIVLHIFKVRYLDYYEVVKESKEDSKETPKKEEPKEEKDQKESKEKEIFEVKPKEKIIIRDESSSGSTILNGLGKIVIFCIKLFAAFLGIWCSISFVLLVAGVVISFMFTKTVIVFIGVLLGLIGLLLINFVILHGLYSFIANKGPNYKLWGRLFLIALIMGGVACGTIVLGIKDYTIETKDPYGEEYVDIVFEEEMKDDLYIEDNRGLAVEYIEEDIPNIKITAKAKHNIEVEKEVIKNAVVIRSTYMGYDLEEYDTVKEFIDNINNKRIVIYETDWQNDCIITVHASKENIEKLKTNFETNSSNVQKYQELMEKYENLRNDYEEELRMIDEKDQEIDRLNDELVREQEEVDE